MFSRREKAILWTVLGVWFVLDVAAWVAGHRRIRRPAERTALYCPWCRVPVTRLGMRAGLRCPVCDRHWRDHDPVTPDFALGPDREIPRP